MSETPSGDLTEEAPLLTRLRAATVGEYEIERELGRGGFAAVFLARDVALDRDVAIKVLLPQSQPDDPDVLAEIERFRREARTVARLNHPHVIPIHAVRSGEGLQYFVMKFVRGRSLDAVLTSTGPLSLPLVQTLVQQAGSALAYAHRQGVVHRDVKPANIMLDEDGWALVADFGIAKVARAEKLTATGLIIGTAAYMSPEQWAGQDVTGLSDEYALGCVAYELITGRPPFDSGSITAMLWAHLNELPRPIIELRPDCPEALERIVLRMLEKDPHARFASLDDAVAAFAALPLGEAPEETRTQLISLATTSLREKAVDGAGSVVAGASTPVMPSGKVARLTVSPTAANVATGASLRLSATALNDTGRQLARRAMAWRSLDPAVATVDADGVVTASGPGRTDVVASCEDVEVRVPVSVSGRASDRRTLTPRRSTAWAVAVLVLVLASGGLLWQETLRGGLGPAAEGLPTVTGPLNERPGGPTTALSDRDPDPVSDSATLANGAGKDTRDSLRNDAAPSGTRVGSQTETNASELDVQLGRQNDPSTREPVDPGPVAGAVPDGGLRIAIDSASLRAGNAGITARAPEPTESKVLPEPARPSVEDPPPPNPAVDVSAGASETCASMRSGDKVLCWGGSSPAGNVLAGVYFNQIAVGGGHICGLTPEGTAYCWGDNSQGQLGDGSRTARAAPTLVRVSTRFVDISVGAAHSCALGADGSAWCWGSNKAGQLGDNSIDNRTRPVLVRGREQFVSLSAGGSHTCGVRASKVYCWGDGFSGQIGNAIQQNQREPFPVRTTLSFRSVVSGELHTCGLTTSGRAWCWGDNRRGQLGNDTRDNRDVPDSVATELVFTQLAVGASHTCGITSARLLACWGENASGQLGDGSRQSRQSPVVIMRGTQWKQVSTGAAHSCGITRADAVLCWGANTRGQLGGGTAGGNLLVPTAITVGGGGRG